MPTAHFGSFGGMFVPETLMRALRELEAAYEQACKDPVFQSELDALLQDYGGRLTPLYFAERWTEKLGGARIYLKREDLLHTGAYNYMGRVDYTYATDGGVHGGFSGACGGGGDHPRAGECACHGAKVMAQRSWRKGHGAKGMGDSEIARPWFIRRALFQGAADSDPPWRWGPWGARWSCG